MIDPWAGGIGILIMIGLVAFWSMRVLPEWAEHRRKGRK
jgi:hypothetical protein